MKTIDTYQAKQSGTIMLNANELPYNLSNEIQQEIIDEFSSINFHRYPDETNEVLCRAYGNFQNIPLEQILAGNGSDEMLGLMIGYFLGNGKKLYTLSPDFSMYDYYASMHEANVIKFACKEDGSFDINDFIEHGRQECVDMVLFSNPNNPSGHALSNKELKKIVEAFPSIPVIIDEAYAEFASESMLKEVNNYPNIYVTRTLSKAFGLAGMRLGFLISNPSNIKRLRPMMVPYNISTITQTIGAIVLSHGNEYKAYRDEIVEERQRLYERVKDLKNVTFYPSSANYVYGRSSQKEALIKALESNGVIIRTYADDSFRITIGSKEENDIVNDILQAFDKEECIQ